MLLGGAAGASGITVPAVEPAIVASVFVLGILIAAARSFSASAAALLVGFFGLFHGAAHGAEIPASADPLSYAAGFIGATALLHALGLFTGSLVSHPDRLAWHRAAGAAVVLCGAVTLLG
jgi:urease accessory protein